MGLSYSERYKQRKSGEASKSASSSASKKKQSYSERYNDRKRDSVIGFDTFDSDLASASDLVNRVYGGWQSADDMKSSRDTVSAMRDRLNAHKSYTNDYGDGQDLTKYNDSMDKLIAAYDTALSDWDALSAEYAKYADADSYGAAKKKAEQYNKYKGLDFDSIQKAREENPDDAEFLSRYGLNVGFSNKADAEKEIRNVEYLIQNATGAEKKSLKDYRNRLYEMHMDDKTAVFKASDAFADGYQPGDVLDTAGATAVDAIVKGSKGLFGMLEGVTDFATYGIAGAADLVGADKFSDTLKSLADVNAIQNLYRPYESSDIKKDSVLGGFGSAVMEGVGQMIPYIATAGAAGTAGLGKVGTGLLTSGTMFSSSAGSGISEARQNGATDGQAIAYGLTQGAIDAGSELLFGGLGKVVNALGVSRGIAGLDDMFAKKVGNKIKNFYLRNAAEAGMKAVGEGAEEVIAGLGSAVAKKLTYMSDEELTQLIEDEDLLNQFLVGAASSAVMQSPSLVQSYKYGTDYVTGRTDAEEFVIKSEFESRVADAEKDGKKLSTHEKNVLYRQVEKDLETEREEAYETYKRSAPNAVGRMASMDVSDTVDNATGDSIKVQGIRTDESGNTVLKTSAGERAIESVTLNSKDAEVVAMAEGMEPSQADLFVSMYSGQDATQYKDSFDMAYAYGKNAFGVENAMKRHGVLTEAQALQVYKLGVSDRTASPQKKADAITEKYFSEGGTIKAGNFSDAGVNYKKLNSRQKAAASFAKMFSKATGVNVVLFESKADEKGVRTAENGRYEKSTNTVYIDVYAGFKENEGIFEDSMIPTMSHELTHWMKEKAPEAYAKLSEIVMDTLSREHNARPEVLVAYEKQNHKKRGRDVSDEYAQDELIARACEDMLSGNKTANEIIEQMDEETAKTFSEKFKEVVAKIREWLKELLGVYKSNSEEAKILRRYDDKLAELQKAWDEGLEKAIRANQAMQNSEVEDVAASERTQNSDRNTADGLSEIESRFYNQLREWLNGTMPKDGFFDLGTTPDLLLKHGAKKLPIVMENDVVWKFTSNYKDHGIALDEVAKLPSQIANPILLLRGSVPDSFVILTELEDKKGREVIVALHLNKHHKRLKVNRVASIYGKDKVGVYVENQINNGNLLYADKKRSEIWFTNRGLQLPKLVQTLISTSDNSIHQNASEVNEQFSDRDSNGNGLTPEQVEFFKDCKIRDENGNLKVMYHGTGRADRVGYHFREDRATSGPMAFFTDNKRIADNYAKDKNDTSIAYDDMYRDYYTQFRIEVDGKNLSVVEAWDKLPISKKVEIRKKAPHVTFDEDMENIVYDENADRGTGGFDKYRINEHGGNYLSALVGEWLEDGTLYGQEEEFLKVLSLVGLDDVQYMNPDMRAEKTYEVYLNVTNPFVTTEISPEMVNAFKEAAETAEYVPGNKADMWDKRNVKPSEWIERLELGIAEGNTHVWTSIPDFVTNVLKTKGYDGIVDEGGEMGGEGHTVVIPFYSNQVKDITNQNPTENEDIRYSTRDSEGNGLTKEQIEFFRDSKVRDEDGNLFVMYHGTDSYEEFTVFKKGKTGYLGSGIYLTSDKGIAERYAKKSGYSGRVYETYVNAKNPLVVTTSNPAVEILGEKVAARRELKNASPSYWITNADIKKLQSNGYDGIVWKFGGSVEVSVWDSNQVKDITNQNPTTNNDIHYSDRDIDSWLDDLDIEDIIDDITGYFFEDYGKKVRAPRRVDEVSKRLKALGLSFTGTKSLAWTDERIEKYLSGGWYGSSNPDYAQAYIAYVTPQQFLNLTVGGKNSTLDMIEGESAKYGELDIAKLGDSNPLSLFIHEGRNKAEVEGHEGRHRMYLLGKAGFEKVPVLLFDYRTKYNKTAKDSLKLTAQRYNDSDFISKTRDVVLTDLVPFSNGNKDLIIKKFGSGANADIHYADRQTESIYDAVGELKRIQRENDKLKADVERLRKKNRLERTVTGGRELNESHIAAVAGHVLKMADSRYSKAEFAEELKGIYSYLQGEDVTWEEFMSKATDVAQRIVAEAREHKVKDDYAMMILSTIRNARVSFNDTQKAEAEYAYGKNWNRNYFGRVTVANDGIPLESAWSEWASMYPDVFDADISDADMVTALLDIYDSTRTASEVVETYDKSEAARAIAFEIYNQFWNVSPVRTLADKHDKEVKRLKFEHRQEMKELRERKDAEVFETKWHYSKLIHDVREARDEKIAQLKKESREYTKQYREKVERRNQISQITKKSLKLNKWLKNNSKDEHIVEELKEPVAAVLRALDFSSEKFLGTGVPTQKDISLKKAFAHLHDSLDEIYKRQGEENYTIDMPVDYVEFVKGIKDQVDGIVDKVGDNEYILRDMTLEQLQDVNKMLSVLTHIVTSANKALADANGKAISTMAQSTMLYADSLGEKSKKVGAISNFFNFDNALPVYFFKMMGDGGQQIFRNMQNGWDKMAFYVKQIIDYSESAYDAKEVKEWSKDVRDFTFEDGSTVKMTTAQIMSLYCLQKREQARMHLLQGGMRVADFKVGTDTITNEDGALMLPHEIDEVVSTLTERQKEVADKLQKFMNTVCSDWGNEVSMKRFGIKSFGEENYFPIQSDASVLTGDDTPKADRGSDVFRLLNMDFTKALNPHANNRIMVDNIFDVFATHTSDMAKYNALALPVLDMFRWYNYKESYRINPENPEDKRRKANSLKQSLKKAYGDGSTKYIMQFMKDINGAHSGGMSNIEKLSRKMISNYKVASVGANIRVAALQPTSYMRASAVIDAKYLTAALAHKPQIQKAKDTCGIALWKSLGFYDTNISRGVTSLIKHDDGWYQKTKEYSMKLAEWGDAMTWGYLYNACEAEIEDTQPNLTGTEKDKAVAERLREVIYATQVVDSTMTRTQNMRDSSMMNQIATSFMSEPSLSYNLLHDLYIQYNADKRQYGKGAAFKKNGKNIARVSASYLITLACASVVGGVFDTLRDDDDEEEFSEALAKTAAENALSDVMSMLPLVRDVVSIYKGFNVGRMDMQGIQSSYYAFRKLYKAMMEGTWDYKTVYSVAQSVGKAFSQMGGLPVSNLWREFTTIWNNTVGEMYESLKLK